MPIKIVVVNPQGVRERTAPTTQAYSPKLYAAGEVIEIVETLIPRKNEIWGMLYRKERAFVALAIEDKTYCIQLGEPENPTEWMQALDAWARTKGYTGPKP